LIEKLSEDGVKLLGVDTPSVDVADSKDLPSHDACRRSGILILEGLVLDGVEDGIYELIALPLKLTGFDASPVRAVLRTIHS
ncbi:MAG: kynurenine formamidase, partial [Planctomycetota bacterium]